MYREILIMQQVVFVVLAFAACGALAEYKNHEEPPYSIVPHSETLQFEERLYQGGLKWVCTSGTSSTRRMFWKLFRYISGNNAQGTKIEMTVPVKTTMSSDSSDDARTMCFYLGMAHQENPPTPSDDAVFIQTMPQVSVFTRKLGGWMWRSSWYNEQRRLGQLVTAAGYSYDPDYFYSCGYDAPFTLWNRRNEAWLVKTSDVADQEVVDNDVNVYTP